MVRLRTIPLALLLLVALVALVGTPLVLAEDPAPADPAPADAGAAADGGAVAPVLPPLASDEEAEEALARFKEDYRARGLRGDDKLSQRDYAMSELARVQHPDVVDALAKISRGSNEILRILAVIYLGEQTALPGLAGPHVLKALKRHDKDPVLVLSALQSFGSLRYLGASDEIEDLMNREDFAIKKAAINAVGQIGDMRLIKRVLRFAGVEVRTGDSVEQGDEQGGKEEVVEEGYSYEGVEVTYDTGTAGDGDQKMAEKIGKEKLAANKRAAMGAAGGRGGGGGGGAGSGASGGRGGVSRSPKELLPAVLNTLYELSGEKFENSKDVAAWVAENMPLIRERQAELDVAEKEQRETARNR